MVGSDPEGSAPGGLGGLGPPKRDRCDGTERLGEARGVVVHAADAGEIEDLREGALRDEAVLDHVGDAGGRAQVVLEDAEGALVIADQIDARDVDADPARGAHAAEAGEVELGAEHEVAQHGVAREDPLLAVHVVEEEAERAQALLEPALEVREGGGGDHAGHEAEGEDLLRPAVVRVDREGHPLVEERELGERLGARERVGAHGREQVERAPEVGARTVRGQELVEGAREDREVGEEVGGSRLARGREEHGRPRYRAVSTWSTGIPSVSGVFRAPFV